MSDTGTVFKIPLTNGPIRLHCGWKDWNYKYSCLLGPLESYNYRRYLKNVIPLSFLVSNLLTSLPNNQTNRNRVAVSQDYVKSDNCSTTVQLGLNLQRLVISKCKCTIDKEWNIFVLFHSSSTSDVGWIWTLKLWMVRSMFYNCAKRVQT